jgi:hypothetical protein
MCRVCVCVCMCVWVRKFKVRGLCLRSVQSVCQWGLRHGMYVTRLCLLVRTPRIDTHTQTHRQTDIRVRMNVCMYVCVCMSMQTTSPKAPSAVSAAPTGQRGTPTRQDGKQKAQNETASRKSSIPTHKRKKQKWEGKNRAGKKVM